MGEVMGVEQQGAEMSITLDALAALNPRGRRDVLRVLRNRRMTVTEVAEALDLPKSSTYVHLQALAKAGLLERQEEDRLWVYYRLTRLGEHLAQTDRPRVVVILGAALAMGAAAAIAFVAALRVRPASAPSSPFASERGAGAADGATSPELMLVLASALALGCVALMAWGTWLRHRQRPGRGRPDPLDAATSG